MSATTASRTPKTSRNLLQIALWVIAGASAIAVLARFISGNTLEHQLEEREGAKRRDAIAQSSQSTPAAIAALYENQRNKTIEKPAGTAAALTSKPGEGGVALRLPEGRPSATTTAAVATESSDTPLSPQRIRAQARASEIAMYGETSDIQAALPTPVNALLDKLQTGKQASNQASLDYLKALQGGVEGRAVQPAPSENHGSLEWLAAQTRGNADDTPLRPTPTISEYLLQEGTPIRIALIQDINSDLPGNFTAMVTRDVYDSLGHGNKLISWGTRLSGRYSNEISPGQNRILFAFQSMRFTSGARVTLRGMPGSDLGGAAGAAGKVDTHFWQMFGSALAVGSVAMLAGQTKNNSSNVTINLGGTGDSGSAVATQALSDVVKQMLNRNQNIKDTLSLNKGEELMIVTNRDMELPPSLTGVSQSNRN